MPLIENQQRWQQAGKKAREFVSASHELADARTTLQRQAKSLVEKVSSGDMDPQSVLKMVGLLQDLMQKAQDKTSREEQLFKTKKSLKDAKLEMQALGVSQSAIVFLKQVSSIIEDCEKDGSDINFVLNAIVSDQLLSSLESIRDELDEVIQRAEHSSAPLNQFELGAEAHQAYRLASEVISHWKDYTPQQKLQASTGVLMLAAGMGLLIASTINPALGLTSAGLLLVGLGGIVCKNLLQTYRKQHNKKSSNKAKAERRDINRSLSTLQKRHSDLHRQESSALKVNKDGGLTPRPTFHNDQ